MAKHSTKAKHVMKVGKNFFATDKAGHIIPHKGRMSRITAGKQVQAIYISQHGGSK